jgi:transaldolase
MMNKKFKIKIFADGADIVTMKKYAGNKFISGLTTNPSLMKSAGINNYENFAKEIVRIINKPISFEVFSDDLDEMYIQAKKICSWGKNIFVKIPITNTKGRSTNKIIKKLSHEGVKLNITAIFTIKQVKGVYQNLDKNTESIISIFAGRIADTGIDPEILIKQSIKIFKNNKKHKILWASTRELYNIIQADKIGCQIITVTDDILKKLKLLNFNLDKYSLDTVKSFYYDAVAAGFKI